MTWKIIVRGAPVRVAIEDYECPIHGRFEAQVDRDEQGDAPDETACIVCGVQSAWRISAPLARVRRFEAIKGKSEKPERDTWLDTTNLGEGQPLHEFWDDRAKIREAERKRDVMAFCRENHESVIGRDV